MDRGAGTGSCRSPRHRFVAKPAAELLARSPPSLQVRGRVTHIPSAIPARTSPHFEMKVARTRSPGGTHVAEYVTCLHPLALFDLGRLDHVHIDVVELRIGAPDHDVVARSGCLVGNNSNYSRLGSDDLPPAVGHQILTLMASSGSKAIAPRDLRLDGENALGGFCGATGTSTHRDATRSRRGARNFRTKRIEGPESDARSQQGKAQGQKRSRFDHSISLFWPTGLADGLALKESRYGSFSIRFAPWLSKQPGWFPRSSESGWIRPLVVCVHYISG